MAKRQRSTATRAFSIGGRAGVRKKNSGVARTKARAASWRPSTASKVASASLRTEGAGLRSSTGRKRSTRRVLEIRAALGTMASTPGSARRPTRPQEWARDGVLKHGATWTPARATSTARGRSVVPMHQALCTTASRSSIPTLRATAWILSLFRQTRATLMRRAAGPTQERPQSITAWRLAHVWLPRRGGPARPPSEMALTRIQAGSEALAKPGMTAGTPASARPMARTLERAMAGARRSGASWTPAHATPRCHQSRRAICSASSTTVSPSTGLTPPATAQGRSARSQAKRRTGTSYRSVASRRRASRPTRAR
mmetsp:Transcript_37967/g.104393  ORF Transcript_37967/g.104393 Transcript_37967/m.104393 type:complete len:313 (-) Transcript_37967:695-1633(-)